MNELMNRLNLMDCMEGMKQFPDKYFDLAIVDPPYGINYNNDNYGRKTNIKYKNIKNDDCGIDIYYVIELQRVSKKQIIWGFNNYHNLIPYNSSWICWDKRTNINADKAIGSSFELAWCSFSGYYKIARIMHGGPINADGKNMKRYHPTQKPVALYRWLLQNYAKKGDLILDTHVGSGSSLIACIEEGFEYCGFEIDEDYYKAACKRIEEVQAQGKIFAPV